MIFFASRRLCPWLHFHCELFLYPSRCQSYETPKKGKFIQKTFRPTQTRHENIELAVNMTIHLLKL